MKASVSFLCQPMSYEGHELKEIYPEFAINYPTTVGYRWQSCAAGPESWDLILKISAVAALVGKGFLEELTKDLYKWSKERLLAVVTKRRNNVGYVAVKFDDLTISIDSSHPNEDLLDFLDVIPSLYQQVDGELCSHWTIEADKFGNPCVRPLPYSVGVRIQEKGGQADSVTITEAIAGWQENQKAQPQR
jgi:hypothetical protein